MDSGTNRGEESARPGLSLARALEEYSRLVAGGEAPDPREFARRYPELHPELEETLRTVQKVEALLCDAPVPRSFGDYRVLREVGRGGMAVVYEAWQQSLDRRVALKVLSSTSLADPKAVARFQREARAAAKLHHDNIVEIYDMAVENGVPYFAMDFVEGETLRDLHSSYWERETRTAPGRDLVSLSSSSFLRGFLEPPPLAAGEGEKTEGLPLEAPQRETEEMDREACRRIAQAFAGAAEGLHHAHARGVVHRDVKPSNLIRDTRGRLRILDFGLARVEGSERLTRSGECVGTLLYMSPEQLDPRDRELGPGTDIYSLGATLYETLTGQPPFRGRNDQAVVQQILGRDPPPPRKLNPRIPRDLETIVLKCLRKKSSERYATAEALAQDLRRFVRGDPIEARPRSVAEKLTRSAWRHRGKVGAAGVLLLALLWLWWTARQRHLHARFAYEAAVTEAVMKMQRGLVGRRMRVESSGHGEYQEGIFIPEVMVFTDHDRARAPGAGSFALASVQALHSLVEQRRFSPTPLEEAVEALEEAARVLPEEPDAHYHRAWGLLFLRREREALEEIDAALGCDEGFTPARTLRAVLLERRGENEAAAAEAERAEQSAPEGWARAWLAAHRFMVEGRWNEAAEAYDRLIAAEAAGERLYLGSSIETLLGRGVARLEAGELLEAIEDFARAHGRWPGSLEPVLLLGKAYLLQGKPAEATRTFAELLRNSETPDQVALAVAALYGSLAMHAEALDWAGQLQDPRLRERTRAAFLLKLAQWREAREACEAAIRLRPEDAQVHLWLGLALLVGEGDFHRAMEALTEAIHLEPENAEARVWLGDALARQGKLDEASREYNEATRLDPRNPWPYISRGVTLQRGGKLEDALGEYRRAFELDSTNSTIYLQLEYLLRSGNQKSSFGSELERFATVLETFLRSGLDHAHLPDLLRILALMRIKDPAQPEDLEKALRYAALAVERTRRRDPESLAALAAAQVARGLPAGAVRSLEEAVHLPHAKRRVQDELERCRRLVQPLLVSYESIDAALGSLDREVLIAEGAEWRYFPGREAPSEGLAWAAEDFDDTQWPVGPSGFGYGDGDDATVLTDMKGSYSSVYIRKVFRVERPEDYRRVVLRVRADDGFVGYLGGVEVARAGLGRRPGPVPYNALAAVAAQTEPLLPYEFRLAPSRLKAGRNLLALQGLNGTLNSSDLSLTAELVAERRSPHPGADRRLLADLSTAPGAEEARLSYLEGRVLQRRGEHTAAASRFAELVRSDPAAPQPRLRLAESLAAAGRPEEAAPLLREVLEGDLPHSRDVCDLWLELSLVDLRRTPAEILARFPAPGGEGFPERSGYGAELLWALRELELRGAIRVNCGGPDFRDHQGILWGRDRLFGSGYGFGGRVHDLIESDEFREYPGEIAGTVDDALYKTERWFPHEEVLSPAYRVPLPPGRYAVALHFAEIHFETGGQRFFDVSIEGEEVLHDYEPFAAGSATAESRTFETRVEDGFLEIEFLPRMENPKLSALEILRVD